MKSKGQAALEFLTTYGWAFLVILVMIAALAYFGVLNPQRFLPDRCVMGAELGCTDYRVTGDGAGSGTLELYLTNNMGETMEDINATVTLTDGTTVSCTSSDDANVAGGESATFNCDLSSEVPADGEKLKLPVVVEYQLLTGQYVRTVNGEVFATVQ